MKNKKRKLATILLAYCCLNSIIGLIVLSAYWLITQERVSHDATPFVILFFEFVFFFLNLFYLILLVANTRPPLYLIILLFILPSLILLLPVSTISEDGLRSTIYECIAVNIVLSIFTALDYRRRMIKLGIE
ncbi:MAG TPA: hypothetical protein PK289_13200 [Bacteroidia bacterium]|nr:hypothetical protein [Bacteroidia bacterium]HRG54287.1 hypothetical protein [Bacteroidia bacterium]